MSWICPRCRADYPTARERCEADGAALVENMAGRTLADRYFIEKLIGVGGMRSTTWRATQRTTQRPVAVKILPAANSEEAQRFERGARIASNLNHPHITTVHDYGTTPDGIFFLVMEILEGQTLDQILRQQPLGLTDTLIITDQILRALEHAHAHNVVHRDLKPSNLFVTKKNDDILFIKILDFGLAKLATADEDDDDDGLVGPSDGAAVVPASPIASSVVELNDITRVRRICGTPEYMAPEQILGAPVDRRTDLYSLGVLLYRLLAGQLPFRARVRHELYQQHLVAVPPPFPPTVDVPDALSRVVMKAIAKRPADRFADAAEMRVALREVHRALGSTHGNAIAYGSPSESSASGVTSSITAAPSTSVVARRDPRRRWLLVGLLAAALLALGVWALSGGSANDPAATPLASAPPVASTPAPTPTTAVPQPHRPDPRPEQVEAAQPAPSTPPTVVAEASAAPQHGTVVIRTTPAGVEVARGDKVLGRTPLQLVLPIGEQTLELRLDGYAASVVSVTVVAGPPVELDVAMRATGPDTAAVPGDGQAPDAPATPGDGRTARIVRRVRPGQPAGDTAAAAAEKGPAVLGIDIKDSAGPAILGLDLGPPATEPVKVLGVDVKPETAPVKVLGAEPPSTEVKILGN